MTREEAIAIFEDNETTIENPNYLFTEIGEAWDLAIEALKSEIEYKAKVKEIENAIAKCEKAEEDFKKRTCKFRSPTNCDFCSFHSDCDEHWKEGEDSPKSQVEKKTKKCPNCGSDLYEYCFMCCYEGKEVKEQC